MVSIIGRLGPSFVGEPYAAITSALKHDVSALELFDDHDPLGLAFYIYAIIECNYVSFETNELAEAGRLWALEKLTGQSKLSVYKDRDVGAVALILYSFRGRPESFEASKLANLVCDFIDPGGGVFSNFFCSTLVGLALRQTNPTDEATRIVSGYINQQLIDRYSIVSNDAKNLLTAYWWARDTNQPSLLQKLNLSAREIITGVQPNLDALVLGSFILLDQAELFSRRERAPIKAAAENALISIEAYTKEALSPAVAMAYDQDVAMFPDESRRRVLEAKPRLSRILIAIGVILQRSYLQKFPSLFSAKARALQISRAILLSVVLLVAMWTICWIADKIGLPGDAKACLRSHDSVQMGRGILLLVANTLLGAVLLVVAFWVWRFVVDLGVYGRCQDEWEVVRRGWPILTKTFWIAIALPLMTNIVAAFLT